jgi:hypothetical protein
VRGGKIKHDVDYWDMATTMRQLGFLPPPAANRDRCQQRPLSAGLLMALKPEVNKRWRFDYGCF